MINDSLGLLLLTYALTILVCVVDLKGILEESGACVIHALLADLHLFPNASEST